MFLEDFLFPMTSVIFRKIEKSFLQKRKKQKTCQPTKILYPAFLLQPSHRHRPTDRRPDQYCTLNFMLDIKFQNKSVLFLISLNHFKCYFFSSHHICAVSVSFGKKLDKYFYIFRLLYGILFPIL